MGLRERLVLLLQLGEQTHVLNCDDRLVGKALEQLNLAGRKWGDRHPHDVDRPYRQLTTHHRDRERGPKARLDDPRLLVLGILREILDMNDPPAFDRPSRDAALPGPN